MKRKHIGRFGTLVGALILAIAFGATVAKADHGFQSFLVQIAGSLPDRAVNVERASGQFRNTIGVGTDAFLAEPGGFVMGDCDIDIVRITRGFGSCATTANSGQIFQTPGMHQNRVGGQAQVPVGGWLYVSVQEGSFWIENCDKSLTDVSVPQIEGMNTLIAIRGCYPDAGQGNLNRWLIFDNVVAGAQWFAQIRAPRGAGNVAFISEGWWKQQLETSFTGGTNCGQGCSLTLVLSHDDNTKGTAVWLVRGVNAPWELIFCNYC